MFRFTLSTVVAVGSVGGIATPLETGMTPIPPLNLTSESFATRAFAKDATIDIAEGNPDDMALVLSSALESMPDWTEEERQEAKTKVLSMAGPRFGYISSIAVPFLQQPFQRPLSRRLEALPEGITDSYKQAIQSMPSNYLDLLRTALTWTLYALARAPHIQHKLRTHLRDLLTASSSLTPTADDFQLILSHPYLDACVREALRLHSPVTSTMRVAAHDGIVPVSHPFRDRNGALCSQIRLNKGDIITVPLQAMHKAQSSWGGDADEFRPERWLEDKGPVGLEKGLQGLWGGILAFGPGNIVNGNRSCIGYRFALNECVLSSTCLHHNDLMNLCRIKIFLYVLIHDIEFTIDPSLQIEKKVK